MFSQPERQASGKPPTNVPSMPIMRATLSELPESMSMGTGRENGLTCKARDCSMTLTSRMHRQDMNLRRLTDWHATDNVRDNLKLCDMAAEVAGS